MKTLVFITTILVCSTSWAGECISGNCFNGIGTQTYDEGSKYVGEHQAHMRHGQGTFTWASGNKYVGEFRSNKRHGQATFTWANGDKYVGEFLDGKRTGQGTYTWANGDKYVGEFLDGNKQGYGVYTYTRGETKTGVWENDTYFGTKAEWDVKVKRERVAKEEAKKERKAKAERERVARVEARKKYERIYNACLLDKSSGVDMQVNALRRAVEETCEAIATDPSWYEEWKYN